MISVRSRKFRQGLVLVLALSFILSLAAMSVSPFMLGGEEFEFWMLAVNSILIAIPLGILHSLLGILILAADRHRRHEGIDTRLAKWLYWGPRICCLILVAFMSLFAFDVFEEGRTLGEMLLAFLMHMLPMIALGFVLAFAWRWPWVGAVVFGLAALAFSIWTLGDGIQGAGTFLIIGAPLLMISLVFAANASWKREIDLARHPII